MKCSVPIILAILSIAAFVAEAQTKAKIFENSSVVVDGASLALLGEGYRFTEGPAVDKEGNVYFTDA